jgi:dynein assembly factor 3
MVTDFDYLGEKLPFVDMSQLKFKERDMLEAIFKFWRNPNREKDVFDIEKAW